MKIHQYLSFIIVVLVLAVGCTSSVEAPCSLEFRSYNITVLTHSGELADSVDISITVGESDESIDPCTELRGENCNQEGEEGFYVIFHDGFKDKIAKGENVTVTVTGVSGDARFSEQYVFTNDGCHIRKVAGPDTVTLEAS